MGVGLGEVLRDPLGRDPVPLLYTTVTRGCTRAGVPMLELGPVIQNIDDHSAAHFYPQGIN